MKCKETPMTGRELFNYESRCIYDKAVNENLSLCTLTIDIDRFKTVNDTYGHDIGDIVIARIMNILTSSLIEINPDNKKRHSLLERDGGDEFRIIVNDTLIVCEKLAQDILDSVRNIDFNDVADDLHITVTIGIASIKSNPLSCSHLFHLSQDALYEAKSKERGMYLVYK